MTPKKMKQAREKLELTQEGIAKVFGLSTRYWRNMELGVKDIPNWVSYAITGLLYEQGMMPENKS